VLVLVDPWLEARPQRFAEDRDIQLVRRQFAVRRESGIGFLDQLPKAVGELSGLDFAGFGFQEPTVREGLGGCMAVYECLELFDVAEGRTDLAGETFDIFAGIFKVTVMRSDF